MHVQLDEVCDHLYMCLNVTGCVSLLPWGQQGTPWTRYPKDLRKNLEEERVHVAERNLQAYSAILPIHKGLTKQIYEGTTGPI